MNFLDFIWENVFKHVVLTMGAVGVFFVFGCVVAIIPYTIWWLGQEVHWLFYTLFIPLINQLIKLLEDR